MKAFLNRLRGYLSYIPARVQVLAFALPIGCVCAYFVSHGGVSNEMTMGRISAVPVVDTGTGSSEFTCEPYIQNTGTGDCVAFISVEMPVEDARRAFGWTVEGDDEYGHGIVIPGFLGLVNSVSFLCGTRCVMTCPGIQNHPWFSRLMPCKQDIFCKVV